jgi:hypothetical protein
MGLFAWRSRFPKTLRGKETVNLLDSVQPWIPTGERKADGVSGTRSAHGKRAASPTESDSDRRTHAKNSVAELLPGKPRESSLLAEMR